MKIATLTLNPALDLTASVERVSPDEKLRADNLRRDPGGGGINVARVVHELGGEVEAVYLAGGANSELLDELLADEGVSRRRIEIDGRTRADITISDRSADRQYRFVMPGPEIGEGDCQRAFEAVLEGSPDYVVASGSLPPGAPEDSYARLAGRCREQGSKLVVDTSGPPLERALEEGVDLIKPNLRELAGLAGRDIEDDHDLEEIAAGLVEDGKARLVVVSMGSGGAVVVNREGGRHVKAPTVRVRSKVGAGDSAVAGLVLALARGDSDVDATRFGVAAGAAAVLTPGTELCHRDDVERLAEGMQRRRV